MPRAPRTILGVDFGAPQRARDQRRKIIAIEAHPIASHRYRVDGGGLNARLLTSHPPGWSAAELLDELLARPVRVAAFDLPFCVPDLLLRDPAFAASVGHRGAFLEWRAFSAFVADHLPLTDPLGFHRFDPWRATADRKRLWTKRATDHAAGAQPPLKDKFQATFQMTLLGNALLARLWESHYRIVPFPGGGGPGDIIEVYPAATLRHMGLRAYKARPDEAIRVAIAACAAAGIRLDVASPVLALCCHYNSGGHSPDHDAADAFVALCTAILYAEGACRPALGPDPRVHQREGAIYVPTHPARAQPAAIRLTGV